MAIISEFNKSFYEYLPKYLQRDLDILIKEYGEEDWFKFAWNSYSKHVMSEPKSRMKAPNLFFEEYKKKVSKPIKKDIPVVKKEEPKKVEEVKKIEESKSVIDYNTSYDFKEVRTNDKKHGQNNNN